MCHREPVSHRNAIARRAVRRPGNWMRSQWEEDDVNDVVLGIETDHGCDRGDHARCCRRSNAGGPALHREPAVTSDPADQETKDKTFEDACDDVPDEQCISDKLEKIGKSHAEISAAN